jgi:flagellar biosynthesis protein FlhG
MCHQYYEEHHMNVLSILVVEDDEGLGNIDVLLGWVPRYTLEDVLCGSRHLSDIIFRGPAEIQVLPAGSGLPHLTALHRN